MAVNFATARAVNDMIDKQNETEGKHYDLEIDPYEYCFKNKLNPLQFNAIKYITRYNLKNGKQDLEKAINTINRLIDLEYNQE